MVRQLIFGPNRRSVGHCDRRLGTCVTLAQTSDGSVYCWGENSFKAGTGLPLTAARLSRLHSRQEDLRLLSLQAAAFLCIIDDGSVQCWGNDAYERWE